MIGLFQHTPDAISILKDDHKKVKGLFDDFEKAETLSEKRRIVAEIIQELKIHAKVEEELFYPAIRQSVGKDLMTEADEEHHVVKILIAEIETMDGTETHYDAKVTVLAENIRHHIKEEEGEIMHRSKKASVDMAALGQKILNRKASLQKSGVPTSAEETMVKAQGGKADSPARAARKKPSSPKPARKTPQKAVQKTTKRKATA